MNRTRFISELERLLSAMPADERKSAIRYYVEYFDDAGPENEELLLVKLGSPEDVAARLLEDSSIRSTRVKKMSTPWGVILSILAAPIAIPLIAGAFCLLLSLMLVVFSIVLVACIVALIPGIILVALFVSGAAMLIIGGLLTFQHLPTMLTFIGMGCASVGLSGLIFYVYRLVPGKTVRFFSTACSNITRTIMRPFRKRGKF